MLKSETDYRLWFYCLNAVLTRFRRLILISCLNSCKFHWTSLVITNKSSNLFLFVSFFSRCVFLANRNTCPRCCQSAMMSNITLTQIFSSSEMFLKQSTWVHHHAQTFFSKTPSLSAPPAVLLCCWPCPLCEGNLDRIILVRLMKDSYLLLKN